MSDADAVVIGGGLAGCAAAIALARAGRRAIVLERERGPHPKVCGEFLSREASEELLDLGLDIATLGAAPIERVRVTWGSASVLARLPFVGASVSRGALDEALLRRAIAEGVDVRRGARALAIETYDDDGVAVRVRDGVGEVSVLRAQRAVLASGKTELAGFRRSAPREATAIGFKTHVALEPHAARELEGCVELTVFAGGYAGMQPIEAGTIAFALVVERATFARHGSWPALLAAIARGSARFAARLQAMRELWPRPLAVSGVPYGFVHRDDAAARVYRVGDQLAVIPSFTGDGMAIALVSGSCAARAIVRDASPRVYHAEMRARLARPMRVAAAISSAIASAPGRAALVWPARAVPALFTLVAAQTRIARVSRS